MKPYLVEYMENYQGKLVKEYNAEEAKQLISAEEAEILKTYMRAVVTDGTARELNSGSYTAYGKTGTAQINSTGGQNSWFIGYGEKDGKKIVVSIVFEEVTSGQKYGVNAAKQIFDGYFDS
jgi:peptidoglycan glycosyltransferase